MLFTKLNVLYVYFDDCFSDDFVYSFSFFLFSFYFFFAKCICEEIFQILHLSFHNKALIFQFEWRKCTSSWLQKLHLAVILILYLLLTLLCLTILSISTSRRKKNKKKNPPLWCCLVFCLMYSSLLILQTRCFFFQWKVLTGEIFKVVLKANKPFLKNAACWKWWWFWMSS